MSPFISVTICSQNQTFPSDHTHSLVQDAEPYLANSHSIYKACFLPLSLSLSLFLSQIDTATTTEEFYKLHSHLDLQLQKDISTYQPPPNDRSLLRICHHSSTLHKTVWQKSEEKKTQ